MLPDQASGTFTFVFTDIEGSTRLWERFPQAMKHALERHDSILLSAVTDAGGQVIKTTGDGLMAVFGSAAEAVRACLTAQRRLVAESWPETGALRVRMGLHSGVAQSREDDYFGPAVIRGARIMAVGHGGQVLLSGTAAALVADQLPDGAALMDLGAHRLKDLGRPEELFQLLHPALPRDFPPLATPDRRPHNLPVLALAAALMVVGDAEPRLRAQADAIFETMDFGFYYDPQAKADVGLLRGGFWVEQPPGCSTLANYRDRGPDVYYTCHHYGAFNTEPRIASYIGIATGQIPPEHYFGPWRTFPDENCDFGWSEQDGIGEWREYLGVRVWEGAYEYNDNYLVPTWGGSMFEALMPDLFVPEARWGADSWRVNHPRFVQAQIHHGLVEADYGYWGFSPSSNPEVATASTVSTWSAWTSPDTPVTRSGRPPTSVTSPSAAWSAGRDGRCPPTTATAWSPRTRPSSRCRTHPTRHSGTWPSCAGTSTCTAPAGSTTLWRCRAARWRSDTSPSTRR